MKEEANRFRWVRAAALLLAGVLAAWSWLFVVSKWGPAQRVDILTFKAGLTSKVMRALLKPAQSSGHHDHDAASISGIYATPVPTASIPSRGRFIAVRLRDSIPHRRRQTIEFGLRPPAAALSIRAVLRPALWSAGALRFCSNAIVLTRCLLWVS